MCLLQQNNKANYNSYTTHATLSRLYTMIDYDNATCRNPE